jgi:2-keto-3-deoxy-L-rhamnonate aldolase RhmA
MAEHAAEANDHVLVVPMIETVAAAAEVPRMCEVEGSEIFFFGPADFSASAGHRGQWEGPGVAAQLLAMKDTLRRAGKQVGLLSTSHEDLQRRIDQGFRMVGLGADAGLLIRSLRAALAAVGREREMRLEGSP